MADKAEPIAVAGEEVTTPTSSLPLRPEDQFRLLNSRLDKLADELSRVAKPAQFRLADAIQLIAIVLGVLIAGGGAETPIPEKCFSFRNPLSL